MTTQLLTTQETAKANPAQASFDAMNESEKKPQIGDFFYSTWGYEQTNVDFYQVIGLTPKGVKLRKVENDEQFLADRTAGGYATPKKDCFTGEAHNRRFLWDCQTVRTKTEKLGYLWDGKPQRFTCWG